MERNIEHGVKAASNENNLKNNQKFFNFFNATLVLNEQNKSILDNLRSALFNVYGEVNISFDAVVSGKYPVKEIITILKFEYIGSKGHTKGFIQHPFPFDRNGLIIFAKDVINSLKEIEDDEYSSIVKNCHY